MKFSQFLGQISLRRRLGLVFGALMLLAILFSGLLLFQQHQLAVNGAQIAISAHEEMASAISMQDLLTQIDRSAQSGETNVVAISKFRKLLETIHVGRSDRSMRQARQDLHLINRRFDEYVKSLSQINDPSGREKSRANFEDVSAAVGAFIEMNQISVYRMADQLRKKQESSMKVAISFLSAFILLSLIAGIKLISIITQPLSSLMRFLDNLNVEDDLPGNVPHFDTTVPEVASVAGSFERLLQRLRGYRALNVRRLLVEKRRADVIAAAISDGVILLRNDDIMYLNPTAEKILSIRSGTYPKGINLKQLLQGQGPDLANQTGAFEQDQKENNEPKENPGARAVLQAISRTMPVELTLESEHRKYHYLVQAYPISYDLIEQVEHAVGGAVDQILDKFQENTLIVAQDVTLVRESQEAKSHFLATLSHEVKTPVTSLTMATRLLKRSIDEIPNPTHKSLILTCTEDVDRLRVLLEDLLTASRFDTLTQRLEIKNTDLAKLMKHSVQSFQLEASEKGVQIVQKIVRGTRPLIVPMDPSKIAWALSNLLTNALRHTPRGGVVEIELEASENGEWVQVKVRDTGPGIERKRQDRIFDKFNPYYDLRVARSGSTGAGLAIAREIVVAHGGRIWVSSEPGHGAEFAFRLPFKRGGYVENENQEVSFEKGLLTKKGVNSGASACS